MSGDPYSPWHRVDGWRLNGQGRIDLHFRGADGETVIGAHATDGGRSEEHTSELQSLMRISYAVFCLKKKKHTEDGRDKHHDVESTTQHIASNHQHGG